MIAHEKDGWWVVLHETIASHHEEVFSCLVSDGGLSRWFPVGATVELRQGGTIVFKWDRDGKRTSTFAILDYDPGGTIVWDWYASHLDTHAPVYWKVEPDVEEGSVVTLRQGPFVETTDSLVAMAEEGESWRWRLCNLRSVLEARHDMRKVRPL